MGQVTGIVVDNAQRHRPPWGAGLDLAEQLVDVPDSGREVLRLGRAE